MHRRRRLWTHQSRLATWHPLLLHNVHHYGRRSTNSNRLMFRPTGTTCQEPMRICHGTVLERGRSWNVVTTLRSAFTPMHGVHGHVLYQSRVLYTRLHLHGISFHLGPQATITIPRLSASHFTSGGARGRFQLYFSSTGCLTSP